MIARDVLEMQIPNVAVLFLGNARNEKAALT